MSLNTLDNFQRISSTAAKCSIALMISLFCTVASALPFDYYLKCDIRERTVHPPPGHMESFTKVEKYVVCIIEAVRNSSQVASDEAVIRGPQYGGRALDDMSCTQLKNRKAELAQRISDLRNYQTAGRSAIESLVAGQMEAVRVATESETISIADSQKCDIATEDFENIANVTPRASSCRQRDPAARADCIERLGPPTPEFIRLRGEKTRLCNAATASKNRLIEARDSVKTIEDNKKTMETKLKNIATELAKAMVQQKRLNEAMAEKSCPR